MAGLAKGSLSPGREHSVDDSFGRGRVATSKEDVS
jgi:hypothetical protein